MALLDTVCMNPCCVLLHACFRGTLRPAERLHDRSQVGPSKSGASLNVSPVCKANVPATASNLSSTYVRLNEYYNDLAQSGLRGLGE